MVYYSKFASFAQDSAGNVIAQPTVEVRRESDNALVSLFSDRAGATPIGNPFTGASDGLIEFYVAGGAYKLTITKDTFSRILRYVPVGTYGELDVGASITINAGGTITLGTADVTPRERLTANRTYYVRTDGNDANTGLVNSAGGAFLTIQKAVDVAAAIDLVIYTITISVQDGTYSPSSTINLKPYLGAGPITIQGNVTTPANVLVSSSASGFAINGSNAGSWSIEGLKITNSGGGGVQSSGATSLSLGNNNYGATGAGQYQLRAFGGGFINFYANYTVSAGAGNHLYALSGGVITYNGSLTITVSGTPAFTNEFVRADGASVIYFNSGVSYSGSATGTRYRTSGNSSINTQGGGETFFPGNAAGVKATGGVYDVEVAAFSAHKNGSDQTGIADITFTTVTWSTELYDIGGYFASDGWTPPAGKVHLQANLLVSATVTTGNQISCAIFKNGSGYKQVNLMGSSIIGGGGVFIAVEDVANGTDVYTVKVYIDVNSGTATVSGNTQNTFFTGFWIGP